MVEDAKPEYADPYRRRDLLLDVAVPLIFALLTAGFLLLAAQ